MASVRREMVIDSSADDVWEVIRDFGTGPTRMAPGFVADSTVEGDTRVVTFADGNVARELFVAADDKTRRIVYALVGGTLRPTHDNSSMQVVDDGDGRCRFIWIHDVLPDDLAAPLAATMKHGMAVIKRTLESATGP